MSILIGVELVVFPVLAGWWLDICTLEATGATFRYRRYFFTQAPVTSTFIHWLLGMLFMSHFASFAAILREVRRCTLHNGLIGMGNWVRNDVLPSKSFRHRWQD